MVIFISRYGTCTLYISLLYSIYTHSNVANTCYTVVHLQSRMNVFVKGLQRCCVEALQHKNAHLANSVVDNFCW